MRRLLSLLTLQLVAGLGCGSPEGRPTLLAGGPIGLSDPAHARLPAANLLFGNRGLPPVAGEAFAARTDWPAADWGYRLGETSYYSTFTWDQQLGFDRFGGSIFHNNQNIRAGVFVR